MVNFIEVSKFTLTVMSFVIAFMLICLICDPNVDLENSKDSPFLWITTVGIMMLLGSHSSVHFHMYGTMLMYFFDLILVIIIEIITQAGKMKHCSCKNSVKGGLFIIEQEEKEKAIKNHPA